MTLSIIRGYALNNGTWRDAALAAAAQIFELARKGFVTIDLRKHTAATEVHLRRVGRPIDNLSPEEQYLMAALFAGGDTVTLDSIQKVRVAQRLMTIARRRLTAEGLISTLTPGRLRRRIYLAYWCVALVAGVVTAPLIHDADSFMVWLISIIVPWIVVWAFTSSFAEMNAVRQTPAGKRLVEPIFSI